MLRKTRNNGNDRIYAIFDKQSGFCVKIKKWKSISVKYRCENEKCSTLVFVTKKGFLTNALIKQFISYNKDRHTQGCR